jgi:hypothetical protein
MFHAYWPDFVTKAIFAGLLGGSANYPTNYLSPDEEAPAQGCQMAYLKTQSANLGKFWRVWQWKMLVYYIAIWSILMPFGMFYCHLVYLVANWYILRLVYIFLVCFTMNNLATLSRPRAEQPDNYRFFRQKNVANGNQWKWRHFFSSEKCHQKNGQW